MEEAGAEGGHGEVAAAAGQRGVVQEQRLHSDATFPLYGAGGEDERELTLPRRRLCCEVSAPPPPSLPPPPRPWVNLRYGLFTDTGEVGLFVHLLKAKREKDRSSTR